MQMFELFSNLISFVVHFLILLKCVVHGKIIYLSPPSENYSFNRLNEGTAKLWGAQFCPAKVYPFMVGIIKGPQSGNLNITCGGSLVHPRVVLSAASCIEDTDGLQVVIGLWLLKPAIVKPSRIRLHPSWYRDLYSIGINNKTMRVSDNVGVVILEDEVRGIDLMRLPKREYDGDIRRYCQTGLIVSAGEYEPNKKGDPHKEGLSCGQLRIIDEEYCEKAFPTHLLEMINLVCTYNSNNSIGIFRSDAGSPLICGSLQIGIASFSIRYKVPLPNVFTRTDKYIEWIRLKFPKKRKDAPEVPEKKQRFFRESNQEDYDSSQKDNKIDDAQDHDTKK